MTRHDTRRTPEPPVLAENPDRADTSHLPVVWRDATPDVPQHGIPAGHTAYSVSPTQIIPGGHPHDLPWHMTALIDNNLPRPHPEWVKVLNYYHVPGVAGAIIFTAFGWMTHREPLHGLMAAGFLTVGVASLVGAWVGHFAHGEDADKHITRGLAGLGIACLSGGAAVGAGPAGISYMLAFSLAVTAVVGTHHWREHKRQQSANTVVDYHAAVNAGKVHIVGGTPTTPTTVSAQLLSHEERRVRDAFEGIGVALSDVHSFKRITETSFSVTVVLAPAKGISPDAIIRRRDELRSALKANQVVARPTKRGHEVILTIRYGEIDELAETIPHPGITVRSIKNPIPLGPAATGETTYLPLLGNHTVVGGTTNNGKSGLVNNIVTQVVPMNDARLVLLDCKPGQLELGIYENVAYASADSFERAALILKALVAVMNIRGAKLKKLRQESGKPERLWDTVDGPALVVVIDELAELFRDLKQTDLKKIKNAVLRDAIQNMNANFVRLCQVARAYAISLVIATQKPDALAAGGVKSGVDQAQNRLCVATTSPRLTNIVLRDGAHGEGFRATDLDTAGKFLMITLKEASQVERKSYWWTDERIAEIVEQYAEGREPLEEDCDTAFKAILAGREPDFEIPSPFDDPGGPGGEPRDEAPDIPRLYAVPEYPDRTAVELKHRAAWEAFKAMGSATIDELKALQLDGHTSRDSCKTALLVFVAHKGAESEPDGRSERFHCLVASAKRREA